MQVTAPALFWRDQLAENANPPVYEIDVLDIERGELGHARPRVVGGGEEHEVSLATSGAAVGSRENGLHLLA